jgi:hypothetical protein
MNQAAAQPPQSGVCPVCGSGLGGAPVCSNCGFNPVSIAAGDPTGGSGAPTRSLRSALVSILVVLLVGGAGFYVARYQRDLVRTIGSPIGLDHAIGTNYSPQECERRMTHYMKGLYAATAQPGGATEVAALQTQAGEEFGVGTKEWRTLLNLYTSHSGVAAIQGARKALKKAAPSISEFCSQEA